MSIIQIADLQATGTELFQGTESFLTDLQSVEASAVYGGKGCGSKKGSSKGSKNKKSGSKVGHSGHGSGHGSCGSPCGGPIMVP